MAYNETISSPKKLNTWQKIKKAASGVYNVASDIGERVLPYTFQGTEERSLKKQAQSAYPMTETFKKYVKDIPVNTNTSRLNKGNQYAKAGGTYYVPELNPIEKVGDYVASKVDDIGVKTTNPTVAKISDYLVSNFYRNLDKSMSNKRGKVVLVDEVPGVLAHEALHGWFGSKGIKEGLEADKKKMSIAPTAIKLNSAWDNLKKNSKDPNVLDTLDSIDRILSENASLYGGIEQDPYSLANERYAYLGSIPDIDRILRKNKDLAEIYKDVMKPRERPVPNLVDSLVKRKKLKQ